MAGWSLNMDTIVWTTASVLLMFVSLIDEYDQLDSSNFPAHSAERIGQCSKVVMPPSSACEVTCVHFTASACPELSKPFCEPRTAWMSSNALILYFEHRSSTRLSSSLAPSMQPMYGP